MIEPQIHARFGSDDATMHGTSRVDLDGGRDAQAFRFEGNIHGRTVGVYGINKRFAGADCVGVRIEEACSGQFVGVKARLSIGTAVFACELARLPWPAIDLGRLKIHVTRAHR